MKKRGAELLAFTIFIAKRQASSRSSEYDRGLWQHRLLSPLRNANAEIPTGAVPFRPRDFSQPSLKYRSGNCDSPYRRMPPRRNCAAGASETRIGSTSQNGSWKRGTSPSTPPSATQLDHSLTVPDQHVAIMPTRPKFLSSIISASPSQNTHPPSRKIRDPHLTKNPRPAPAESATRA